MRRMLPRTRGMQMISFSDKDWDRIRTTYRKWWKGELGRPILPCVFWGKEPGRDKPFVPLLSYENCLDMTIPPEQIIDRYDYELSCCEYAGDSFPCMQMAQFGPGVTAAFLGADPVYGESTIWFKPARVLPLDELHFEFDENNVWWQRILAIYRAGMRKWRGNVVMGMTDLGGMLDLLAVFRTTENLLLDLYDEPKEVLRLLRELSEVWMRCYAEIVDILCGSQGYTDWGTIYYEQPSYMLQSDFSYMLGPEMFQKFVEPELRMSARRLGRAFYHLDGVGELRHLDALLAIEDIKGIQWIPGEGEPRERDWSYVYRKIDGKGKKLQVPYGLDCYTDEIIGAVSSPDTLIKMQITYPMAEKGRILNKLKKYGAEP